jgi:hypothetical protein
MYLKDIVHFDVDNSYLNNQDFVPDILTWHQGHGNNTEENHKICRLVAQSSKGITMKIIANGILAQNQPLRNTVKWHAN